MPQFNPPALTILTGSSRGLGAAIATQLLERGDTVLALARHTNDDLIAAAKHGPERLQQWPVDLTDATPVARQLADWLQTQDAMAWREVRLINNAGVIPSIVPLSQLPAHELVNGLRVGLEAAMLLTSAFLAATEQWKTPRKVLNISSGLGRKAMASQAVYCAAKAGMDHFTRCVALEEARKPHGAKLCAMAPGVIATDMQRHLRAADRQHFPDLDKFEGLHASGQLQSPADTATRILARLERTNFGDAVIADVRD